jgi:hypothetical protein
MYYEMQARDHISTAKNGRILLANPLNKFLLYYY